MLAPVLAFTAATFFFIAAAFHSRRFAWVAMGMLCLLLTYGLLHGSPIIIEIKKTIAAIQGKM
jgi:hypothetical protein